MLTDFEKKSVELCQHFNDDQRTRINMRQVVCQLWETRRNMLKAISLHKSVGLDITHPRYDFIWKDVKDISDAIRAYCKRERALRRDGNAFP